MFPSGWFHYSWWPPGWFPKAEGEEQPVQGKGKGVGGKKLSLIRALILSQAERARQEEERAAEFRTRQLAERIVRHRKEYETKLLEQQRQTAASIWYAVLGEI